MQHFAIPILLWGITPWIAASGSGLDRFQCLWPPWPLNIIIRMFNQGHREQTGSAVRCQYVPDHLQSAKIFPKLHHHMRTIKMVLQGELGCRFHTLQNTTVGMKASACCVCWYHRGFCHQRLSGLHHHSEEEMLKRKIPSSGSLLYTTRATGLSESPFKSTAVSRFSTSSTRACTPKDEIQPEKLNGSHTWMYVL